MKFLSITGPKEDIDRVVDTYLSRYEIHLENALSELKTVKDLRLILKRIHIRMCWKRPRGWWKAIMT